MDRPSEPHVVTPAAEADVLVGAMPRVTIGLKGVDVHGNADLTRGYASSKGFYIGRQRVDYRAMKCRPRATAQVPKRPWDEDLLTERPTLAIPRLCHNA